MKKEEKLLFVGVLFGILGSLISGTLIAMVQNSGFKRWIISLILFFIFLLAWVGLYQFVKWIEKKFHES